MSVADSIAADRSTVVLLHSLGTDHSLWRHQVPALTARYQVLAPDARGHGTAPRSGEPSIEGWIADLRSIAKLHGPLHLVGVSMGGLQAMAFAATHPELVRSIVIANSFARMPQELADARLQTSTASISQAGMAAFAQHYLNQTLTRELDASDYAALFDSIANLRPDAYLASAETTFRANLVPLLESISCPALVVIGELDVKVPTECTTEIVDGISGALLETIPSAGHLSCIENPAQFNNAITAFLDRVGDRAPTH
ncbi:alpha/beta fold hydrolase (plasmid) [Rhodococcus opacus]|uniref:alpha/beta fold hydrolase n=1 Tax=Rhodococcus opacus TaxID=37919 RepID=UPI00146B212A|nr:alpha/beta fold hydrolase [Rhodococcus opacus]MDV6246958.1 alpha/beta fold hydrolase [Rhodococcus opacus]WKN60365.1 alpha/beta fold hydrolase [Rhodococcus opacus]